VSSHRGAVDRSTMKVVLALILVVSVPYLLLHHVYLALQRTVAGVTRAGVSIVVADYNEVRANFNCKTCRTFRIEIFTFNHGAELLVGMSQSRLALRCRFV
jgi:hypothetical protein